MAINPGEQAPVQPIELKEDGILDDGFWRRSSETFIQHALTLGALSFLASRASAQGYGDGDYLFDWG